jgi:O-antigen/teichoic acid export membrane protein
MRRNVEPTVKKRADRPLITGSGAASIGIGSTVAAVSGYGVLVLVAHVLSPAENADFLVFWSLLFALIGVLGGLQQEATRAIATAEMLPAARAQSERSSLILPWSLTVAAALTLVVLATSPWWRASVLAGSSPAAVLVLCAGGLVYSGHLTVVGTMSGRRQWSAASVLIGGESLLRLILVGIVALGGVALAGLEAAATASTVLWLLMPLVSPTLRSAIRARADATPARLVRRSLQAMLAALGSSALVVGFPTLLRLSSTTAEWSTAAPLVLAISLTRAPLLIPLNAFQGVAIGYFLDPRRGRAAAMVRVVAGITGVGVVGAALAALVGPPLMGAFFGTAYRMNGWVLGALTLAAVALAVLTMTGAGVLALARHRAYAAGWLVAMAVSLGLVFTPLSLDARAILSLAVGPVVGIAVHVLALRGAARPRDDADRAATA